MSTVVSAPARASRPPVARNARGFMKTKLAEFETDLALLHKALKEPSGPYTAKALAARFECSKQAIYSRIAELESRGVRIQRSKVREGEHGPKSEAYALKQAP